MISNINFNKWKINNLSDEENLIKHVSNLEKPYLLDLNKKDNFNLLEQFVYRLASLNIDNLKDNINKELYIEFSNEGSFEFKDQYFKEDKIRTTSLFSSYMFLTKTSTPLIITNIDFEKYKYKNFNDENEFLIVFPDKLNHVSFNGKFYHGFKDILNEKRELPVVLKINVYDKKPNSTDYYNYIPENVINEINFDLISEMYHTELLLDTKCINRKFMENILYEKNKNCIDLKEIFLNFEKYLPIENYNHKTSLKFKIPIEFVLHEFNYLFVLKSYNIPLNQKDYFLTLINKFGYIMHDILDCNNNNKIKNTNCFYKEKIHECFYPNYVCQWIINEIKNPIKNINIINVEQFPYLFKFCILSFEQIIIFINKMYNLNGINIDILGLQIIKENENYSHNFDIKSMLKVRIPLSDINTYKQGDLIVSNNILQYTNNSTIEGDKFTLVFYLNFVF
jgi:hypothetical protein